MNSLNPTIERDMSQLYANLLAISPRGTLPFVTPTNDHQRPFGALVIDERSRILASATASTPQGVVDLIAARLPAGRGEVRA